MFGIKNALFSIGVKCTLNIHTFLLGVYIFTWDIEKYVIMLSGSLLESKCKQAILNV